MPLRVGTSIYSWTSTEFRFDGLLTTPSGNPWNVVSVDYAQKRERKIVYSNRKTGRPRGKTPGKYSLEPMAVKMFEAQALELQQYLTQKGLGSYGDADFSFLLQVSEPVPGAIPITMVFEDCTWDGDKVTYEEGIEENLLEVTIGGLQMTRNGMRLWSVIRGLGGNG
jgi:hypothetical protein